MSDSYLFIYFGKIDQIRTSKNANETKKHIPAGEKHKQVTDRTSWNPLKCFIVKTNPLIRRRSSFCQRKISFSSSSLRIALRPSLLQGRKLASSFLPGTEWIKLASGQIGRHQRYIRKHYWELIYISLASEFYDKGARAATSCKSWFLGVWDVGVFV